MKDVTILKKAGLLNDNINIFDTIISKGNRYPLELSDSLKEYIDCLDDATLSYSLFKALDIFLDDIAYYWKRKDNEVLNENAIIDTFAKYIGEDNAYIFASLILYANCCEDISTGILNYKSIIYSKEIVSFNDLIGLTLLCIFLVTDRDYINMWESRRGKGFLEIIKESINISNAVGVDDLVIIGRLSYLPEEEKKNIIGSLWNCIIDIIERISSNDVKGGEEDE